MDLDTPVENTWCPGCGDFAILSSAKQAFQELVDSDYVEPGEIVISSGIGCHAKIVDYIKVNSFYSIHGRVPPTITGVKIANPNLEAIGFAGDGDAYDEGVSHLIHAARRNIDVTMIVHDNRVFALTTGQFTPTSPEGFKGKSTPKGSIETPLNPLHLMLANKASFVARSFSGDINHLKETLIEAIQHPGFAIVDVLQPCVSFYNTWDYYKDRVYKLSENDHDTSNFQAAWEKAEETNEKIPIGVFYKEERATFDEKLLKGKVPVEEEGTPDLEPVIKDFI
ncbi:MAG: 2-oxoacid:ferredoxin oxidoreductase subunit beta [Hadesarchaea archaeon]|nr:2-oxoacid:ferredoxin oxidoreductase subunit beta [Hadesarchaea archaeon]